MHTGISWTHLPAELGFGSGVTCWRRLDEWQKAGVWERLHELLLARLRAAGEIEWSRAVVDASHVQAKKGAPRRARARLIGAGAAPSTTSSSTRRDPARLGAHGRQPPRRHPADPARSTGCRRCGARSAGRAGGPTVSSPTAATTTTDTAAQLRQRGIKPEIARRNTEHGSGLGRYRWVVERTFAWLHQFKRLLVRYDRRADIHEAFLALGCCLVCYRRLRNSL